MRSSPRSPRSPRSPQLRATPIAPLRNNSVTIQFLKGKEVMHHKGTPTGRDLVKLAVGCSREPRFHSTAREKLTAIIHLREAGRLRYLPTFSETVHLFRVAIITRGK